MAAELTFGYSPCPNDTYMFNAIASGRVAPPDCRIIPVLHDVETLNELALIGKLAITKLSFYAWLKAKARYKLLGSGAAMGFGCGPVLIANRNIDRSQIDRCRVVLPGQLTTAHLLFRLWAPHAGQRRFIPYDQIFDALASGQADCGVIIHESRFTFESAGFEPVVDLGAWWEAKTGLPVPLGGIALRQDLAAQWFDAVDAAVHNSIRQAMDEPEKTLPYIRKYAQEMDDNVLQAHIRTFVNDFSLELGDAGYQAIDKLEEMARQAGVL